MSFALRSLRLVLPALFSVALVSPGAALSQTLTRIGSEFRINVKTPLNQGSPSVAADAAGGFAVFWVDARGTASPYVPFVVGRFYDSQGRPLGGEREVASAPGPYRDQPFVVSRPAGGFKVLSFASDLAGSSSLVLEDFLASGAAAGGPFLAPPLDPEMTITNVAMTPAGRLILSWLPDQFALAAARLNARGQLMGKEIAVAASDGAEDPLYPGDVAVDSKGNAVVTWAGGCGSFGDDAQCDIFAQRLSTTGGKVGPVVPVNTFTKGVQDWARVAVAPDGRFLAVWQTREPKSSDPFAIDVAAQFFSATGQKLGAEFRLGRVAGSAELFPDVAADPAGNFVVVWSSFRRENGIYGWDVYGQLFRRDGKLFGKPFRINTHQTANEFARPKAAFGGNGTFVVIWNASDGSFDGVFGQRFAWR